MWLGIILLLSIFELAYNGIVHQFPKNFFGVLAWSFLNDLFFWLKSLIYIFAVYIPLNLFSQKFARTVYAVFIVLMAVIQVSLTSYFTTSLVPLGADLYSYSVKDIKQTVGASGVSFTTIIGLVVILACSIAALRFLAPSKLAIYFCYSSIVMDRLPRQRIPVAGPQSVLQARRIHNGANFFTSSRLVET